MELTHLLLTMELFVRDTVELFVRNTVELFVRDTVELPVVKSLQLRVTGWDGPSPPIQYWEYKYLTIPLWKPTG